MSLRTKGLLLIVIISLIPLLIAGYGNYTAVKHTMLQTEYDKIASQLDMRSKELSAWISIRQAELLIMSRTRLVRYGTSEERIAYFERELARSGFSEAALGFIDSKGMAARSDGASLNLSDESFFQLALKGEAIITDPYTSKHFLNYETVIAVPVFDPESFQNVGVLYAAIPFTSLLPYLNIPDPGTPTRLYNQDGLVLYCSDINEASLNNIQDKSSKFYTASAEMLLNDSGTALAKYEGKRDLVFYTKVADTPWRLALQVPESAFQTKLNPIFWRIMLMIVLSEATIVLLFLIYFERIIHRLKKILSVTELAAGGTFRTERLNAVPRDEIGMLAHSVNGMTEHLQEMFDRLSAIINQNQYPFIVLDENYYVTYMNKAAEEMLGYELYELKGIATPLDFIAEDEINREAQKLSIKLGKVIEPSLELFQALQNEHASYEREWFFIRKDGTRIPTILSSNGLHDRSGQLTGIVGMLQDITERKKTETVRNRLLEILESAKDLIASVDIRGDIVYINKAGKELLGITSEGEMSEGTLEQFVDNQMFEVLRRGGDWAKRHGFWESDAVLKRLDGQAVYVSMIVVTHIDELTGEIFFSCVARDVSEQKLVQEELLRATLKADEANRAKSHFLALMSHEIRTPLNGIIGLLQLMNKTELSQVQKEYMNMLAVSSETLLHIINDVLDFSKIEAGKVELDRYPFQLDVLLQRLTNQLSVFLDEKENLEFILDVPKRLPLILVGDAVRLEQVLLNLCTNAIKFTYKGNVRLKVEVLDQSEQSADIRFLISDTGIGMSEEQMDKLFKPFTQADSSTTRKFGGTGLGLVISKTFVDLMGGELQVSSEEGIGSTFEFVLTFASNALPLESAAAISIENKQRSVWIVEDNKQMREQLLSVVDFFEMKATEYSAWEYALEQLLDQKQPSPDIIIFDMSMFSGNKIEHWLELKHVADKKAVRTVAITTSSNQNELLRLAEQDQPYCIVTSPITRMNLFRAMNKVFETESNDFVKAARETAAAISSIIPSTPKILLVEDNKINQMVAIEMLQQGGYEVELAENGSIALQKFVADSWDLVLMDIHMPVLDGVEAVRAIRQDSKYDHIPIIAMTANAVKKDHESYISVGMNDVITKPVRAERLYSVIDFWLKGGHILQLREREVNEWADKGEEEKKREQAKDAHMEVCGMDIANALERINGKKTILLHMMRQFSLDYFRFSEQLSMEISNQNVDVALRMLHTLRGASGYLSAIEVYQSASRISELLKENDRGSDAVIEREQQLLKNNLSMLIKGMEKYLKENWE